ncbi:response regulator transcription factor [Psychrobium sp. 1_MG-2023]|uniref:response regulator transcription factor n=1 Tax=Psychrobium sp. 1_MG-2023 TaxID=3062624 RepID=UPI000C338A5E|nr:response regulator [Psychrobium sp. 1_MG-2023]MDP2562612.1 response regulator [Psychrobium sp. 1_MG-2023]PKF54369.1 two-component system response regulator [Alteromonadales bacterium alter-6D02]
MELAGKKLLIIEDDLALATTLANNLKRRQLIVEHVDNVDQALAKCQVFRPELLLIDLKLGLGSGLSLISPIRQLLPHSRIVVLTGYASIATAVEAIKLGANDYLPKPISITLILASLTGDSTGTAASSDLEIAEKPMSPARLEWEHLQKTLKECGGNVSKTARVLGLHRRTLQRKLDKKPSKQ